MVVALFRCNLASVVALAFATAACGGAGAPTAPTSSSTSAATSPAANASVDITSYTSTTVHFVVPAPAIGLGSPLYGMTGQLVWYLGNSLDRCQAVLPKNPGLQNEIIAKILMLANTNLAVEIMNGKRWYETSATSIDGRRIAIATMFPLEAMRGEATDVSLRLAPVVPLLERFYNQPLAGSTLQIWYGFSLGSSGGSGVLRAEDRSGYLARSGPAPYEAILGHEVGHAYMAHESLNQFLELYAYNLLNGSTTDVATWTWTRYWTPDAAANIGIAALLDVYKMMGFDAMQRAYRTIAPLKPAYSAPLAANVIDAFVATVPAAQQNAVRVKLNSVGY